MTSIIISLTDGRGTIQTVNDIVDGNGKLLHLAVKMLLNFVWLFSTFIVILAIDPPLNYPYSFVDGPMIYVVGNLEIALAWQKSCSHHKGRPA
jgi:hypothetical protein